MTAPALPRPAPRPLPPARTRVAELLRWDLRERWRSAAAVGGGLLVTAVMVFALYPAVSESFGELDLPEGFGELLGGASFDTLPGWVSAELLSMLAPFALLLLGGSLGAAWLAGREEGGVATLLLSTPASRREVVVAAAAAATLLVGAASLLSLGGFVLGDALIADDLPLGGVVAVHAHLFSLGVFGATLALALGALSGRRGAVLVGVGAVGVVSFLVQGVAASVDALGWTEAVSVFSWALGADPLTQGLDPTGLLVVLAASVVLLGVALRAWPRRDLRV